jgi:hypothetical protein
MLANLLTLNVLQQKTIGLPDSDGLQNPALGKAAIRQAVKKPTDFWKNGVSGAYRGFRRPGC